jgi:hypothetical protein
MAMCEHSGTCTFIDRIMSIMPTSAKIYTRLYCEDSPKTCARYMVEQAMGRDYVPFDLSPHQRDKAKELISRPKTLQEFR